MALKILGLLFIVLGFAAPYISRAAFPEFLFASSISIVCFWAGFLLELRPSAYKEEFRPYLRWANYAIFVNIALSTLFAIYIYCVIGLGPQRDFGGYTIIYYLSLMANPIRSLFDRLVDLPQSQNADGSIIVIYSFTRSLLTCFFNLVFYSSAGSILKIIKDKVITRRWSVTGLSRAASVDRRFK